MTEYFLLRIPALGKPEAIRVESASIPLDLIQRCVGGYFEVVRPARLQHQFPHVLMLVNEEGKLRGLPLNILATYLFKCPQDVIVGDVLLVTTEPPNPDDEPDVYAMTDDDERALENAVYEYHNELNIW